MQKLWDTVKRLSLHITGIDEREESQVNSIDQLFNKIIGENVSKLIKVIQIQEINIEFKIDETRKETPTIYHY